MSLRDLRFQSDYFIEVSEDGVTITNRRIMVDFYQKLKQLLQEEYGVELFLKKFDPQGDDWP